MKKVSQLVVVSLLFLMASMSAYAAHSVNAIAAIVNNQLITQVELNAQVAQIKSRLHKAHQPVPGDVVLKQQVLQQMINNRLVLEQAKQAGLTVNDKQLDMALQRIAAQNRLTQAQLYKAAKKNGLSITEFREQIRKQVLAQILEGQVVASRVSISEQEISDYLHIMSNSKQTLAQYHLRDILIALPDSPTTGDVVAAQAKADKVVAELKKGANFNKLVASVSGGQEALHGGDLGWRTLAELPTPFVSVVEKMKVSGVAGPIRTPNGFHVIKLLAVHDSSGLHGDLIQRRKEVQGMIFQRKFREALVTWLSKLRSQAYVKIFPQD